jgi:hypothetical protein
MTGDPMVAVWRHEYDALNRAPQPSAPTGTRSAG